MTIRAIAWDIDGTLVDSEWLHHRAMLAASLPWRADLSDLPDQMFRGVHVDDVWAALRARLPADLERADWLAAIEAHNAREADSLKPLAGAVEAVHVFAARGLPQVCVSNSNRRIVDANLRALGIAPFIDFSISADDVRHGKPHPDPFSLASARLGIAPASVLAVEDSVTGMRSAQTAGLPVAVYAPGGADFAAANLGFSRFEQLVAWAATSPAAA